MGGPVCDPVQSTTNKPNTDHDLFPYWRLRAGSAHGGHYRWRPDSGDRAAGIPGPAGSRGVRPHGAQFHERCPDQRSTHRNGYRERVLTTQVGDLTLAIPKLRQGSFFPN